MMLSIALIAAAQLGASYDGYSHSSHRPIATRASYPAGMADDVRRPGFNGRLWVSRPVAGWMQQGPYPMGWGVPGPEAYGAFDNQDAGVYARVGHLVVGITPWESMNKQGLKRLEAARNFWLVEQGFVGGVRTFVNDSVTWKKQDEAKAEHASGTPTPRATIQLPADMPRQHRRLRVDADHAAPACPGVGPARVSWPMAAPAAAVARTQDGLFTAEQPSKVIIAAK